jgi:hypothetical protein
MDASSEALAAAVPSTRTVAGVAPALPAEDGEVGLVPEYVLLNPANAAARNRTVLAPADHTAMLRFTWLPTVDGAADPAVAAAMSRLLRTLVGPDAGGPLAAAGLRGPQRNAPAAVAGPSARPSAPASTDPSVAPLPPVTAAPFDVLQPHHVEHVFATWYAADRRANMLLVVDVSGSMASPAPGSNVPLIELVKQGCNRVGELLPDDARLGLWEFGSQLAPPQDYREVLPKAAMTAEHRQALAGATGAMAALQTGTGLYDTLVAAYTAARDGYQDGMPNHVVLFTDGRNQDDPGSMSPDQLGQRLAGLRDEKRPVQLTVLTFGSDSDTDLLKKTLKPVGGYVELLTTADDVRAAFIHVAAGGLHN